MPKYWVDVEITTRGRMEIEADSLEAAQEKADDLEDSQIITPFDLSFEDQDATVGEVYEVKYVPRKTRNEPTAPETTRNAALHSTKKAGL